MEIVDPRIDTHAPAVRASGEPQKLTADQIEFAKKEAFIEERRRLGLIIVRRFTTTYEKHGIEFDPDTCYEAAEDVLKAMASASPSDDGARSKELEMDTRITDGQIEALLSAFDTLYKYASDDGCPHAEGHRYSRPNRARLVLKTWLDGVRTAASDDGATRPPQEPSVPVQPETDVAVAGNMERSIADFIRACGIHLVAEQENISPNNALIGTLCEGVRMAREYLEALRSASLREPEIECTCDGGEQGDGLCALPHEPHCPKVAK